MGVHWDIKRRLRLSSQELVSALYRRGTTMEEIFKQYYELDEIATHHGQQPRLSVADLDFITVVTPVEKKPF